VDVLPSVDADGGVSADELVRRLVKAASDISSSLFDGRILGLLNGLKRIDGYGAALTEQVLLSDMSGAGAGYAQTSVMDIIKLIVFAGGVGLASVLCCGIAYGTCKVDGSQHAQIEELNKEKDKGKEKKIFSVKKEKATAEEKQSLAVDAAEEEDGDVEEAGATPRMGSQVPSRALSGDMD